jgi:hypothetical protein
MKRGPKILTPNSQRRLCDLLATANTVVTACDLVSIAPRTFHEWMRRGENEQRGIYRKFYCAVARARAEAKRRLMARIVSAAERDWKAAAWTLQKLFPAEFGAKAELEPNAAGNFGVNIAFDTGGKSIRELLSFPILGKDLKEQAELESAQEENIKFWEAQVQNAHASK